MNFAVVFEFGIAALNFVLAIVGILSGWHSYPVNLVAGVACFCYGLSFLDN